jgi:biotin operon repressor
MNNDDVIAPECVEQLRNTGVRIKHLGTIGNALVTSAILEPVAKPINREQIEAFWQARQVLSREHFIERLRALGVEVSDERLR